MVGVAVLGAIVNARLTGERSAEINRLGLGSCKGLIVNAVEHGGLPSSQQGAGVAVRPVARTAGSRSRC